MASWPLMKTENGYYVMGLAPEFAPENKNTLLVCRYPQGDCDTVSRIGENMHRALYDLYQTHDGLKDGDEFTVRGRAVYRCEGVHVVRLPL